MICPNNCLHIALLSIVNNRLSHIFPQITILSTLGIFAPIIFPSCLPLLHLQFSNIFWRQLSEVVRCLRLLSLESFEDPVHLLLADFALPFEHLLYGFGDFVPLLLTLLYQINLFVLVNYQLFKFLVLSLGLFLDNLRQFLHFACMLICHLSNLLLHF